MSDQLLEAKITLTNSYGEYSVLVRDFDMSISDVFEKLIIPVLNAAGYSTETINAHLNGGEK